MPRAIYPSDITQEQFEVIRPQLDNFKKTTKPRALAACNSGHDSQCHRSERCLQAFSRHYSRLSEVQKITWLRLSFSNFKGNLNSKG
jgi:hypothetical protein